ncbi:capsular biosynthesis protein [Aeromonas sp. HMWF014]|uniref:capsular biosynthesis protein n=1 Tax=Aeromonas sp. HMWF014 TaxID=2056850 RepID=UPI002159C818|nr:capsular biosynthesis protein [Aeromonas sp. HMWF014]
MVKINVNGGDECWPCAGVNLSYHGEPDGWNAFLRRVLKEYAINTVLCYGDCRFYHRVASQVCELKGLSFWALEEGYLRPDFVTLEQGGVNAFSPWYEERARLPRVHWSAEFIPPLKVGKTFAARAWYASRYHISKAIKRSRYPHFVDHRPWTLWQEARGWLRSALVKYGHRHRDRALLNHLKEHAGLIFLVPLQVSEDFQIKEHSEFGGVEEMIAEVVNSFARHANPGDLLLFKHHPMDRGYVSYRDCIDRLVAENGLTGRVFYGYELPLPALYPLLKGVVTINSTVGLSALLHQVPTICLGRALYDITGLTTSGPLSSFWQRQSPVCEVTFQKARNSLLHLTQLNASFYRHLDAGAKAVIARMLLAETTVSHEVALCGELTRSSRP